MNPSLDKQANREVRLHLRSEMTPRLLTAASMVRKGAVVADVGTDHAYLPIYLISEGIADRAVASDINAGPLSRAEENIRRFGLTQRIATRLTPGLAGIEAFAPTDILICGMGGEMIASILDAAEFVRDPAIRLVLQPMTSVRELRIWLAENGFSIIEERFAAEREKLYVILSAVYCGFTRVLTDEESYLGFGGGALYLEWGKRQIASLQKQVDGLARAGKTAPCVNELIERLNRHLERNGNESN